MTFLPVFVLASRQEGCADAPQPSSSCVAACARARVCSGADGASLDPGGVPRDDGWCFRRVDDAWRWDRWTLVESFRAAVGQASHSPPQQGSAAQPACPGGSVCVPLLCGDFRYAFSRKQLAGELSSNQQRRSTQRSGPRRRGNTRRSL